MYTNSPRLVTAALAVTLLLLVTQGIQAHEVSVDSSSLENGDNIVLNSAAMSQRMKKMCLRGGNCKGRAKRCCPGRTCLRKIIRRGGRKLSRKLCVRCPSAASIPPKDIACGAFWDSLQRIDTYAALQTAASACDVGHDISHVEIVIPFCTTDCGFPGCRARPVLARLEITSFPDRNVFGDVNVRDCVAIALTTVFPPFDDKVPDCKDFRINILYHPSSPNTNAFQTALGQCAGIPPLGIETIYHFRTFLLDTVEQAAELCP